MMNTVQFLGKAELCGRIALSLLVAGIIPSQPAMAQEEGNNRFTAITKDWQDPVFRQYDFWIGKGHANWRSRKPDNFFHDDVGDQATHWVYPTLNGKALLEFALGDDLQEDGSRIQGFSVRYFDTEKDRWVMAQEWPNLNSTSGIRDQLQGFYRHGRIQVFSTYTTRDLSAERTRRYSFSDIRAEGFHWHGISTGDKGKTWSAGTLVEYFKIEPKALWPAVGEGFSNFDDAKTCSLPEYRDFDALSGGWAGTMRKNGEETRARLTGYLMLGGCAVISYLEIGEGDTPYTLMEIRSPGPDRKVWWVYRLDSLSGTNHGYQAGEFEGGRLSLYDNNHYVIEDEFKNLSPRLMVREDAAALKKTVWTNIGPDRLAFEWWFRVGPEEEWEKEAEFSFKK